MPYLKLPKTCSDHAVGVQSVQQALDNNYTMYFEQFDPNHAAGLLSVIDRTLGPGRHDDALIARAAVDFEFRTIFGLGATLVATMGSVFVVGFPTQTKTGQWRIYVTIPRIFTAVATIKGATAGVARHATCFVTSDATGPHVVVSTWNVESGLLADYDFSLAIWAEGVA